MRKFLMISVMTLLSLIYTSASARDYVDPTDEKPRIERVDNVLKTIKVNVPSKVKIYKGDAFDIGIRTNDSLLQESIKYEIKDSTLQIWIDDITPDEIIKLNSDNIRISIIVPNEVAIKTNSSLSIASIENKKKKNSSYENN